MEALIAFVGVAALTIMTPGPDTALTVRNALIGGRACGTATALGVSLGLAVWTVTASAGIAALLVASEPAFMAVKLAGAAYLVFLGGQSLWHAVRGGGGAHTSDGRAPRGLTPSTALRQGIVNDLGNPKIAVFFTSLLPQFGSSFWSMLALGLAFCSLGLIWLSAYSFTVARAGDLLRRPRIRRSLDALTGTLLVAFGIRLAADR
jgi:threonine/homoserine/homoserine lactone efflux protein